MTQFSNMMGQDSQLHMVAEFDGDIEKIFESGNEADMPVLTTRNMVCFPGVLSSVTIARSVTRKLAKYIEKHPDQLFAIFCQKDQNVEEPTLADLCEYGVIARFVKLFNIPGAEDRVALIVQACARCRLTAIVNDKPFMWAHVVPEREVVPQNDDIEYNAIIKDVRERIKEFIDKSEGSLPFELRMSLHSIDHPTLLVNMISYHIPISISERSALLACSDIKMRALNLLQILNREIQYANLKLEIQDRTKHAIDEEQKNYFLRQQIKSIKKELSDEEGSPEKGRLKQKAATLKWNKTTKEEFEKELSRLDTMHPSSSEYNVQLSYLQQIVALPWNEYTTDSLDLKKAKKILDRNHYGMEKVKERILEYMAVLALRGDLKSPILCLYGPPGVGKTSLCQSIADSLGRKYVRVSLGGMHDESEIRGHRRTYLGSIPGRIIKSLEKAGSSNPVFVLDEIDKITQNAPHGNPSAALLEVLDPEQNEKFHDNYIDLDYDLSKVMFIATANDVSTIPAPLRDRMEMIEVGGYTTEEKTEIAKKHLVPREKEKTGLADYKQLVLRKSAIETIIEGYTRESGVRQLEKQINKLFRKIAFHVTLNDGLPYEKVSTEHLTDLLGKKPFSRDIYQGNEYAGVVTGLAWTSVGGEILFIETSLSRGKGGKLTLTGNLGDVMKESATIALEYVKAHFEVLNIDYQVFDNWNIHIHVPEGATPKDGPSAGITIATSIASALTQRKVAAGIAMTGEITLRGKVLPVGGIKEKILAAKRAGINTIILCQDNKKDIDDISEIYLKGMTFHYVKNVSDVWNIALTNEKVENPLSFEADPPQAIS